MSRDAAREESSRQPAPAKNPAPGRRSGSGPPPADVRQSARGHQPAPVRRPGSLEKAITLLTFLSTALHPMSLAELSRRTGLPKTTAYRLLGVLCRKGFAQRIGIEYALGDNLAALAGSAPRMIPGTRRVVLPHLLRLYELTHLTVNLAVARGLDAAYVERLYGHGRVSSPSDVDDLAPLHCTAAGKVLLAFDHELNAAFRERGTLSRMTRRTQVDPVTLERELSVVRRQRVAYSNEEFAEGLACAAAPVFGPDGRVCMAVAVAGGSSPAPSPQTAALVKRTAHAVTTAIGKLLSSCSMNVSR